MVILASVFISTGPAKPALSFVSRPFNPITDVCWWCVFPIKLGGVGIPPSGLDTASLPVVPYGFPPPICWCPKPTPIGPVPIPGITLSIWEPKYIFEVVREPYTFPSLGFTVPPPTPSPWGSAQTASRGEESFYHVHAIAYPLLTIMNFVTDMLCLGSSTSVDISYITELDPTWDDSTLAFLLAPEGALIANMVGALACVGDCLNVTSQYAAGLSTASTALGNSLFWCAGCVGFNYPMDGHISQSTNQIQDSTLLVSRLIASMTRKMQFSKTAGPEGVAPPNIIDDGLICHAPIIPFMQKAQYKLQMTIPRVTGFCFFLGTPTSAYSQFENFPIQGEDFGYLLWQKFDCCSL